MSGLWCWLFGHDWAIRGTTLAKCGRCYRIVFI